MSPGQETCCFPSPEAQAGTAYHTAECGSRKQVALNREVGGVALVA